MPDWGGDATSTGRLAGLRIPEPPADLREGAVSAAAAALATETTSDVWSQLWTSPPLRLAWTAAVLTLLVANVAVTLRSRPSANTDGLRGYPSAERLPAELAEIADLPPIDPGVLTRLP